MTAPATNGNRPPVTGRDDARRRMRVVRNPGEAAPTADSAPGSAYTRAIPDDLDVRQGKQPSKVRDFVSLHGGEVVADVASSWPATERPSSLAEVARKVWPRRGERRRSPVRWLGALAVGVFRLAVYAIAYLLALAVGTDKRAAVALALTLLTVAVICTAQALPV